MDLFTALADRRSVRSFKPDTVPDEILKRIVELATLAPNGSNRQPWRFVALRDPAKIEEVRKIVDGKLAELSDAKSASAGERHKSFVNLFAWAPAVFFVFQTPYESHSDKMIAAKAPELVRERRVIVNTALQSVASAITCLTLAAHALGYGTCWMTAPLVARAEIEKYLGAPSDHALVAVVPIGKPEGNSPATTRKPVDDVLEII